MKAKTIASWALTVFIAVGMVFALLSFFNQRAEARIENNDQVVRSSELVDNVAVRFELLAETTATSTIAIDLSDTTNFPHVSTGALEIAQIHIDWDSLVAATTTIKFGVLASSTDAGDLVDVYFFDSVSFSNYPSGDGGLGVQSKTLSYSPSAIRFDLSSGAPSRFLSDDSLIVTAAYATTTELDSANGFINPGVGDMVMEIYGQAGTASTSITVIYSSR